MREIAPMTLAELDTAPFVIATTAVLDAPLDAVFVELGDPSPWYPLMKSCTWDGRVGGVGSIRDVSVRVFGSVREQMLAWDPGRRVAFTMTHTSSPLIARMGEDMAIERVAGGTQLTWRMVAHPSAAGRVMAPALRLVLGRMSAIAVKRLARCARAAGKVRGTHAS